MKTFEGWYCAHCQRGVDASEVTFYEQHTVCERTITDDVPPEPPVKESLTTERPDTHLVSMPLPVIAAFWGVTEEEARKILHPEEQPNVLPRMTVEQVSKRAREFAPRVKSAAADTDQPEDQPEHKALVRAATDEAIEDHRELLLTLAEQERNDCAEQPEDGPVAHMMISDDHCQLRFYLVKTEAEVEAKRFNGVLHPLYPESVKAERDALRVDMDRSKARTDRAINEIRALREKIGQLEYSNAVNADAKAQAAKHAEEADRLRELVKGLETNEKRFRFLLRNIAPQQLIDSGLPDLGDVGDDELTVDYIIRQIDAAMQEGKS